MDRSNYLSWLEQPMLKATYNVSEFDDIAEN